MGTLENNFKSVVLAFCFVSKLCANSENLWLNKWLVAPNVWCHLQYNGWTDAESITKSQRQTTCHVFRCVSSNIICMHNTFILRHRFWSCTIIINYIYSNDVKKESTLFRSNIMKNMNLWKHIYNHRIPFVTIALMNLVQQVGNSHSYFETGNIYILWTFVIKVKQIHARRYM